MTDTFEATAPCRVDLAAGPVAVSVAIDRRAWCRVEAGVEGLAVESKDTLQRLQVARASELDRATGPVALVREALLALGLDAGFRVATQLRVPAGSGLGGETALAVALVGALARAAGRAPGAEEAHRLAGGVVAAATQRAAAPVDVFAARHGGCVAAGDAGPESLHVDPAAVEECLMLVEASESRGPADGPTAAVPEAPDLDGLGERVRLALVARRFDELARALDEDWCSKAARAGWETPERGRMAALLRPSGAGLRACGGGQGSVLAIVAPPGERAPGPREAAVRAAREASVRLFPARVDLLGLDVEKTA